MGESRAWPALLVTSALALIFALIAGVSASAAVSELTRGPSVTEVRQAAADEVARRWQVWPAGRVFPATLPYITEQGGTERAQRVGVSTRTSCDSAVDAALRRMMRHEGCQAVLRATYLDALEGVVVTIGLAAFPDTTRASAAQAAFAKGGAPSPGLRALSFPGTVADRFTASGRQHGYAREQGPYLVLITAGQVDGRPARAVGRQRSTLFAFTTDLADEVLTAIATPASPDCSAKEWRC